MNDNILKYKEYYGSVDFSSEDGVLFGEIQNIDDVILYEGRTLGELRIAFEEAVEDYLAMCKEIKKEIN